MSIIADHNGVSLSPGPTRPRSTRAVAPPSPPSTSPAALRSRRRTWRDPRLAVGVLLVAGSVVAGAQLFASGDDAVAVLAARGPLVAGQRIDADDVTTVRLRFASDGDADRYLPADAEVVGEVAVRAVGAGELLPRAAVDVAAEAALAELPLAVDPGRVPAGVRTGSLVDVWVGPAPESGAGPAGPDAELLLDGVPVLAASSAADPGAGGLRQVVVGVLADDEAELSDVVARLGSGLLVVGRPR